MVEAWLDAGEDMTVMCKHPVCVEILAEGYQVSRLRSKFETMLAQKKRSKLMEDKGQGAAAEHDSIRTHKHTYLSPSPLSP